MLSKLSSSLIVASAAAGIVLWWYYRVRNLNRIPEKWQLVGYVDCIAIYPVKSCGYKTLNRAECTERGLKEIPSEDEAKKHLFRDREFLIYDVEKEHVLSIHKCQKALLITVHSTEEDTVVFQAPGKSDYKLKLSSILQNPKCLKIRSYTSIHETVDCGDDVAEWFSNYLVGRSEGFRLGYFVDNVSKTQNVIKALADQSYELLSIYKHIREDDAGIYSSLSSYLVTNRSSLDELNNRLTEEDQCNIFNFRPNIVVRDCKPFEEDNWEWIKIGNEIVMRYFKPCTRCTITTIDANTSKRNKNLQPFKMLKSYRKLKQIKGYDCQGDSPVFGINVGLYAPGKIKVGDPVYASF